MYYPIIGHRKELVSSPLGVENMAKLDHVGAKLFHQDKIWHRFNPDLLQAFQSQQAEDCFPSSKRLGCAFPQLVHRHLEGVLIVEGDRVELSDRHDKEGCGGQRVNP
jgi:hypothetical protein